MGVLGLHRVSAGVAGEPLGLGRERALLPLRVEGLHVPILGAARGGFINSAGASTIWYWEDKGGTLAFTRVIQLPANSTPADVRISYDNRLLYVSLFAGNAVQQYDVSDPLHPKFVSEVKLEQPNMMKLTSDSRRLYVSNSLLSNLDGKVPFRVRLLNVGPGGMQLDEKFAVDFDRFPTGPGRPVGLRRRVTINVLPTSGVDSTRASPP